LKPRADFPARGYEKVWFLDHPGPWAGKLTKIVIERITKYWLFASLSGVTDILYIALHALLPDLGSPEPP
jgi:hypothetical protein